MTINPICNGVILLVLLSTGKLKSKKMNIKNARRAMLLFASISIITLSLSACAKKMNFATSSVVPAAQGTVKLKSDNNHNTRISLSVERLADPDRLTPAKKTYVVWMETENNGTKNIGSLGTSSGMLSGKLKSSLSTVTAFKPTAFFISAEDDASILYPGGQVVLRTK
ncbi:MAG: hypothetical protein ABI151_15315 [Chitinophagaceae bacterium]